MIEVNGRDTFVIHIRNYTGLKDMYSRGLTLYGIHCGIKRKMITSSGLGPDSYQVAIF